MSPVRGTGRPDVPVAPPYITARNRREPRRPLRRGALVTAATAGGLLAVVVCLLVGYGWLYVLRGAHLLGAGPRVADSLPLLQLASFDGQPLLRVIVAWLLAGAIAGVALMRVGRVLRVASAGPLALVALLVASQAAYALTRNLPFSSVLTGRRPGFGPVLEAICFAAGCALPALSGGDRGRWGRMPPVSWPAALRQLGLGGGESR